jgi:hypothetical protein
VRWDDQKNKNNKKKNTRNQLKRESIIWDYRKKSPSNGFHC